MKLHHLAKSTISGTIAITIWPIRGLGTDHLISRPMKGFKINCMGRGRQMTIYGHVDSVTGPAQRVWSGLVWSGLVWSVFCWTGMSGGTWRISASRQMNKRPTEQPLKNRAIQISFVGQGCQGWNLEICNKTNILNQLRSALHRYKMCSHGWYLGVPQYCMVRLFLRNMGGWVTGYIGRKSSSWAGS